ncbi:hypothetical protein DPMN_039306 [Dreissena polymorpha]|uniref:Uncharacterized protein n=1 Tax=Dreissena polymorpha TaxID=45954 RepID=A0A9D4MIM2_DREPO|nr:hypothetical protein DPMN_039306 [Dreissena polymorpha]
MEVKTRAHYTKKKTSKSTIHWECSQRAAKSFGVVVVVDDDDEEEEEEEEEEDDDDDDGGGSGSDDDDDDDDFDYDNEI